MPATRCRPFGVLDAMALVAATGFAFAWMKHVDRSPVWHLENGFRAFVGTAFDPAVPVLERLGTLIGMIYGLDPLFGSWSVACLGLHLMRPRPPASRLTRRPGFVFSLAVSVVFGQKGLEALSEVLRVKILSDPYRAFGDSASVGEIFFGTLNTFRGGFVTGVLVCSAVMIVGRRCRPEPCWLDRLGRGLGSWWIFVWFVHLVWPWL